MAYSAGLGEADPRWYDTERAEGPRVHPLFPVSYEWPVSQPIRSIAALRPHFARNVHADHDLIVHRPPRPGDRLQTRVSVVTVAQRRSGAYVVFRYESHDAGGIPVSTTDYGVIYRGVEVEGPDRAAPQPLPKLPDLAAGPLDSLGTIAVAANAAHIYTECARIFNPIHTDLAHARAEGLPGILLHGTATLALSISRSLEARAVEPSRLRRVQCRFTGMVLMPSTLEVHGAWSGGSLAFETRGPRGETVIARGRIEIDD